MPAMGDTNGTPAPSHAREGGHQALSTSTTTPPSRDEAMICERCGKAEMYRMHAVWRCPACGFKTDCCGW